MGGRKGPETDYLIGVDQKIPDWLMKRVFLGEVEAAIRSGIKSRFGILGFSTRDAIWACGFLFNYSDAPRECPGLLYYSTPEVKGLLYQTAIITCCS